MFRPHLPHVLGHEGFHIGTSERFEAKAWRRGLSCGILASMKDIGMLAGMKNMLAFVVFALAVPGIHSATAAQDVPPAPVAAEEALGGFGGSLELPKPGLLFQPCLKPNGWTARFSVEDRFTKPAQGEHTYFFVPDADRDGERLAGTATFTPTPDGGVAAAWSVARSAAHPSARAAVGVDFRLP